MAYLILLRKKNQEDKAHAQHRRVPLLRGVGNRYQRTQSYKRLGTLFKTYKLISLQASIIPEKVKIKTK